MFVYRIRGIPVICCREIFFAAIRHFFLSLIKDQSKAFTSKLIIQTSAYWWHHTCWICKQGPSPAYSSVQRACLLEGIQGILSLSASLCRVGWWWCCCCCWISSFPLLQRFLNKCCLTSSLVVSHFSLLIHWTDINFFSWTSSVRISSLYWTGSRFAGHIGWPSGRTLIDCVAHNVRGTEGCVFKQYLMLICKPYPVVNQKQANEAVVTPTSREIIES